MSRWNEQEEFNTMATDAIMAQTELLVKITKHLNELEARIEILEKSSGGELAAKILKDFIREVGER